MNIKKSQKCILVLAMFNMALKYVHRFVGIFIGPPKTEAGFFEL